MQPFLRATICALALVAVAALAAGAASAEKPGWAGKGKSPKAEERVDVGVRIEVGFNASQRELVRDYYGEQFRAGRCPPGLAKKHNGCMPPGQAKKWQRGQPLPRDVIFHDLPPELVVRLGAPPPKHRFVRVASDVLLIAVGTGMVVDAIVDLHDL